MCTPCVQVGTAVVTRGKDQRLALGRLGALVEQLEALLRSNRQMILVSSGSVSVGKQKLRQSQILNSSPLEMQMAGTSTVCSKCAWILTCLYTYSVVSVGVQKQSAIVNGSPLEMQLGATSTVCVKPLHGDLQLPEPTAGSLCSMQCTQYANFIHSENVCSPASAVSLYFCMRCCQAALEGR